MSNSCWLFLSTDECDCEMVDDEFFCFGEECVGKCFCYIYCNIIVEDLLVECDLPSQDAVIVRKNVEGFILAAGNEIFKIKTKIYIAGDQIFCVEIFYLYLHLFMFSFCFISISLLLFEYTCI